MRIIKRQSTRFTIGNENDEKYSVARTYSGIKQAASDSDLEYFGTALAGLLPGDKVTNITVTITSDVIPV